MDNKFQEGVHYEEGVHYVVEIKAQRVEKVTKRANVAHPEVTERVITEIGHVILSDKVLQHLLKKSAKALELIGE